MDFFLIYCFRRGSGEAPEGVGPFCYRHRAAKLGTGYGWKCECHAELPQDDQQHAETEAGL